MQINFDLNAIWITCLCLMRYIIICIYKDHSKMNYYLYRHLNLKFNVAIEFRDVELCEPYPER